MQKYRNTRILKYRNFEIQKHTEDRKLGGEEQLVVVCTFCPTVSGRARGSHRHCFFPPTIEKLQMPHLEWKPEYITTQNINTVRIKNTEGKIQIKILRNTELMFKKRQLVAAALTSDCTAHGRWTHPGPGLKTLPYIAQVIERYGSGEIEKYRKIHLSKYRNNGCRRSPAAPHTDDEPSPASRPSLGHKALTFYT